MASIVFGNQSSFDGSTLDKSLHHGHNFWSVPHGLPRGGGGGGGGVTIGIG